MPTSQAVLLKLVLKGATADAEHFVRFVAVGCDAREGLANEQLLHFGQRRAGTQGVSSGALVMRAKNIRQSGQFDIRAPVGNDQPLYHVAQLPHVAWPGKTLAELDRVGGHLLAAALVPGG